MLPAMPRDNRFSSNQPRPAGPRSQASGPDERVAKVMARRGMCSRREAERLIEEGQVVVDGVVIRQQGVRCALDATIEVARMGQGWLDNRVTIILNKPMGIVSTQPEGDQVPAWKLLTANRRWGKSNPEAERRVLEHPYYLNVTGRLDKDSRGLLLMTQDGVLSRLVTGGNAVDKRYLVSVDGSITQDVIEKLRNTTTLDDQPLLPMKITPAGPGKLRFRLNEGKKHQVRRVCQAAGLKVKDLLREGIGPWSLGELPEGSWMVVDPEEVRKFVADTSKKPGGPPKNRMSHGSERGGQRGKCDKTIRSFGSKAREDAEGAQGNRQAFAANKRRRRR